MNPEHNIIYNNSTNSGSVNFYTSENSITSFTTTTSTTSTLTDFVYRPNNSKLLDEKPLKHFLMKYFTWIKDVTEVSLRNPFNRTPSIDIYITVSPIHHTELMDDRILRIVNSKIEQKISSLLIAMYPDITNEKPNFIFLPEYSETILELI